MLMEVKKKSLQRSHLCRTHDVARGLCRDFSEASSGDIYWHSAIQLRIIRPTYASVDNVHTDNKHNLWQVECEVLW